MRFEFCFEFCFEFEFCFLSFVWNLVLGIWNFIYPPLNPLPCNRFPTNRDFVGRGKSMLDCRQFYKYVNPTDLGHGGMGAWKMGSLCFNIFDLDFILCFGFAFLNLFGIWYLVLGISLSERSQKINEVLVRLINPELFPQTGAGHVDAVHALVGDGRNVLCRHV